jgi:hypothetical protein
MARTDKHLLPGFGGQLEFTLGAGDVLQVDCSKCATVAVVVKSNTGGGSVAVEQTFDGVNYFSSGSALVAAGSKILFPITNAIGKVKLTASDTDDSSDSSSSTFDDAEIVVTVTGFGLPVLGVN